MSGVEQAPCHLQLPPCISDMVLCVLIHCSRVLDQAKLTLILINVFLWIAFLFFLATLIFLTLTFSSDFD